MDIFARQGDLIIERASEKLGGDAEAVKNYVLAGGSGGHPHTLVGAAKIVRRGADTTVHVGRATRITHAGGHRDLSLEPGAYLVRRLRERGGNGDVAVND